MEPETKQVMYTDREKELARWFEVEPELIRALREVAERIRATNVVNWTNPLVCHDS